MNGKFSFPVQQIAAQRPHLLLAGMLLSLHVALAWGVDVWWLRASLLVHVGLFLMWQPLWRGERQLSAKHTVLVLLGGLALVLSWHNWWLVTLWLGVLVSLVGGDVAGMTRRRQRLGHLIALLYLLAMLLLWVVPHLFADMLKNPALEMLVRYGLIVLPFLDRKSVV